MFSFRMNLMYVARCRLCLLLQNKCRLCFPSSSNKCADISMPVATMDSSRDRQITLAHPSLLGANVATDVFGLSLLSYHSSNALVVTGQFPMKIVTYGLLLQCLIIVVTTADPNCSHCRFWVQQYTVRNNTHRAILSLQTPNDDLNFLKMILI
jgi:hypothetical protein